MKAGGAIDFSFTRDLLSARRADGEAIVFTRQERTILLRLIGSPGRLLRPPGPLAPATLRGDRF